MNSEKTHNNGNAQYSRGGDIIRQDEFGEDSENEKSGRNMNKRRAKEEFRGKKK